MRGYPLCACLPHRGCPRVDTVHIQEGLRAFHYQVALLLAKSASPAAQAPPHAPAAQTPSSGCEGADIGFCVSPSLAAVLHALMLTFELLLYCVLYMYNLNY